MHHDGVIPPQEDLRSVLTLTLVLTLDLALALNLTLPSRESSQVLCITMVLVPPKKISEVYSSIARLLSPTKGTYLRRRREEEGGGGVRRRGGCDCWR